MRRFVLSALVLLSSPALAGCFSDGAGAPAADAPVVAGSAEEAGATAGPAPAAASEPFQVAPEEAEGEAVTAFPVAFDTNPAKAPVTLDFAGEFSAVACNPMGGLPFDPLGVAQNGFWHDFVDQLQPGDVFGFEISVVWTNTDQAWGEIHSGYAIGAANDMWEEPTGEARGEIVLNFTGQQYWSGAEDVPAGLWVACWYGSAMTPIPYAVTVTLHFAEAGVPAATPVALVVPAEATRLFVSPLALDASRGVMSHYRLFGPDDELLCECSLSSNQAIADVELDGAGTYVIIVDHSDNGFVSFAMDAPSPAALRALAFEWTVHELATSEGGAVDTTVQIEMATTPLLVGAWVLPPPGELSDAGEGQDVLMSVVNSRGEVLRQRLGSYVTYRAVVPGAIWMNSWQPLPVPGLTWEFMNDHHAYGSGVHDVTVSAQSMRGQAVMFVMTYVR